MILQIGQSYSKETSFSQEDVSLFSKISGDYNPIHTKEYVLAHPEAKGVIVQGMMAASRFGEVLGTVFPGYGSINMQREVEFLKPLYVDVLYTMTFTLIKVDVEEHVGRIRLEIKTQTGLVCVKGETVVKNDGIFTIENYGMPSQNQYEIISSIKLPEPRFENVVGVMEALLNRRSIRFYDKEKLSLNQLSGLLWSANGVNKKTIKTNGETTYLFTNPTASNHQEVELYVFSEDGICRYEPTIHTLELTKEGDYRNSITQLPFVKRAPVILCLVSNIKKMVHHTDEERIQRYSCMDVGYVSQNIYLYCAANGMATCACGMIERDEITRLLCLNESKVMLLHPIGIRKKIKMEQ